MLMRTIVFKVFIGLWQLLRMLALVLVIIYGWCFVSAVLEWAKSPKREREFYDPYVCGQISGYILRYPRSYVPFWPEYEGLSSWEPGFTKNKKGCGANLTELTLVTSWPEMKPGVNAWFSASFKYDFDGLQISIRPASPAVKDMRRFLEWALEDLTAEQRQNSEYIETLGFNHVRGFRTMRRASVSDFYWNEVDGEVTHVAYCPWLPIQQRNNRCVVRFFVGSLEAFVEVMFQVEKLERWQEIVRASEGFLNEGLIGSD